MAYDLTEEENGDGNKLDKSNELGKSQSKDKRAKKDRKSPTKSKAQLSQTTPGIVISMKSEDVHWFIQPFVVHERKV